MYHFYFISLRGRESQRPNGFTYFLWFKKRIVSQMPLIDTGVKGYFYWPEKDCTVTTLPKGWRNYRMNAHGKSVYFYQRGFVRPSDAPLLPTTKPTLHTGGFEKTRVDHLRSLDICLSDLNVWLDFDSPELASFLLGCGSNVWSPTHLLDSHPKAFNLRPESFERALETKKTFDLGITKEECALDKLSGCCEAILFECVHREERGQSSLGVLAAHYPHIWIAKHSFDKHKNAIPAGSGSHTFILACHSDESFGDHFWPSHIVFAEGLTNVWLSGREPVCIETKLLTDEITLGVESKYLQKFLEEVAYKRGIIVDVERGLNSLHSKLFLCGEVYAFETDSERANLLEKHLELNNVRNCWVYRCALSDSPKRGRIKTRLLDDILSGSNVVGMRLPTDSLSMLRGAIGILSRCKPLLLFEGVFQEEKDKPLFDFLSMCNYSRFECKGKFEALYL